MRRDYRIFEKNLFNSSYKVNKNLEVDLEDLKKKPTNLHLFYRSIFGYPRNISKIKTFQKKKFNSDQRMPMVMRYSYGKELGTNSEIE